jgi:hypothetical protein
MPLNITKSSATKLLYEAIIMQITVVVFSTRLLYLPFLALPRYLLGRSCCIREMCLFLLVLQRRCRVFRTCMRRSVSRGMAIKTSHSHSFHHQQLPPSATSRCHHASRISQFSSLHSRYLSMCLSFDSRVKPRTVRPPGIPSADREDREAVYAILNPYVSVAIFFRKK